MRAITLTGLGLALLAPSVLSGCVVDAFCFAGCDDSSFGGAGNAGGAGAQGGSGNTGGFITTGGTSGAGGATCEADTQNDVENCGSCGHVCQLPGAFAMCQAGECRVESCAQGFYDLDGDPTNGCEYACEVPVIGAEICDGIDNDCDGDVDLADSDLMPPTGLCNTTAGTPCETAVAVCLGAQGWGCDYPTGVETDQGFVRTLETKCDGIDGNCDGTVDETFFDLGKPCDDGGIGVCRDFGEVVCDPNDDSTVMCDLTLPPDPTPAGSEVCNGLDDDCNGQVDEGITFDMAAYPASGTAQYFVDRWEASRPDATSTAAGLNENIACTASGVMPWTAASWSQAKAACEARGTGYRLCTAQELRQICEQGGNVYPYGTSYEANTCNGDDYDGIPGGANDNVLLPTGSLAMCKTADDVFDLSGNATEWTSTKTGATNEMPPQDIYQLHGGSYLSPGLGLSCNIDLAPRAGQKAILQNIGFRCCKDP
ncbi:MAG: SUMF1/EgtB/PvdO family nonheme iron enzyme [Polyangiaceae bacterium]|nr:SUMF1/EgtB/PvdO family nonheme iron enzyme [Polyangiaceae bacterium]